MSLDFSEELKLLRVNLTAEELEKVRRKKAILSEREDKG